MSLPPKNQDVVAGDKQDQTVAFTDDVAMCDSYAVGSGNGEVQKVNGLKLLINLESYKTTGNSIIFQLPRLGEPDVRLTVFGQSFTVHSSKLKEASALFSQMFDAPDTGVMASKAGFESNWVTVVEVLDEKLAWGFQASDEGSMVRL